MSNPIIVLAVIEIIAFVLLFLLGFSNGFRSKKSIVGLVADFVLFLITVCSIGVQAPEIYPLDGVLGEDGMVTISDNANLPFSQIYYTQDPNTDPKDGNVYEQPFSVDDGTIIAARTRFLFRWSELNSVVIQNSPSKPFNLSFNPPMVSTGFEYESGTCYPLIDNPEGQLNKESIIISGEGIYGTFSFNRKLTEEMLRETGFSVSIFDEDGAPSLGNGAIVVIDSSLTGGSYYAPFSEIDPPIEGKSYTTDLQVFVGESIFPLRQSVEYHQFSSTE